MNVDSTRHIDESRNFIWPVAVAVKLESVLRPHMGWAVLLLLLLLSILPAFSLRINHWIRLGENQGGLEAIGPLSVCTIWLLAGWRAPRRPAERRWFRIAWQFLAWAVVGVLLITQIAAGWLPGPIRIVRLITNSEIGLLPGEILDSWLRLSDRIQFWFTGVQAGTAPLDRLVFLLVASLVAWIVAGLSAAIIRSRHSGLAGAFPLLWLLGTILLYSSGGRFMLVFALGVTVALHLAVDQGALMKRWHAAGYDHSADIYLERVMLVIGAALLLLTFASLMPNLYIQPLVNRYYAEMQPYYSAMENTAERLFPGMRGTSRLGGGLSGGLPNEFLLSSGPDLTDTIVMNVRTDEPIPGDYPYEYIPPVSHYMRGGTFSEYDGHGWRNSPLTTKRDIDANTPMTVIGPAGRREVTQQVALQFGTRVAYVAAEPLELSMDVRQESRTPGDIVALWSSERSYTVVSLVPAVNEQALVQAGTWPEENPLPEQYAIYLELPDTVTARTTELAQSLVAEEDTLFERAQALEQYLRTFEYDLDVPATPDDVVDVTDYFLFDLQRGYCDYYATAFVVMARSVGIPARFATGYASGNWYPEENQWSIAEADAHSWPEVFFPAYGWIAFEPTAGLPELTRIGLPNRSSFTSGPIAEAENSTTGPGPTTEWNWQMLFWLLPIIAIVWLAWNMIGRLRRRREQPWPTLLKWGDRIGRPISDGETVLEYGQGLAAYVVDSQHRQQDLARVAASEMRSMAHAVSDSYYARMNERSQAEERADRHWHTLREYLSPLRRSR